MNISKEIQSDLRAFGNKLFVAQRGVFFKFADAPKWKKKLAQSIIPWRKFTAKYGEDFEARDLIDFVCGLEDKIDQKMQEISESEAKKAFFFLDFLFAVGKVIFVYSPLLPDIVKAQQVWGRDNLNTRSFVYCALLGSLLDSAKPQE